MNPRIIVLAFIAFNFVILTCASEQKTKSDLDTAIEIPELEPLDELEEDGFYNEGGYGFDINLDDLDPEEVMKEFFEAAQNPELRRSRIFDTIYDSVNNVYPTGDLSEVNPEIKTQLADFLRQAINFVSKLSKRMNQLAVLKEEFWANFDGFMAANDALYKIQRLNENDATNPEILNEIVIMSAEANKNLEFIKTILDKYQVRIIEDEDGLGDIRTVQKQLGDILALNHPDFKYLQISFTTDHMMESLKNDTENTMKTDADFVNLIWTFREEQKSLISFGKELWIINNSESGSPSHDEF